MVSLPSMASSGWVGRPLPASWPAFSWLLAPWLQQLDEETTASVLASLQYATECAPNWAKAWHHFALYNVECMQHYASLDVHTAQRHVAPAVMGFFRSIALSQALGERQLFLKTVGSCCEADESDAFTPPERRMRETGPCCCACAELAVWYQL